MLSFPSVATSVTVIEEGRVAVPPAAAPPEPALFKLSTLDAQWITLPLIQRVLVFDGAGDVTTIIPPFEAVVASLRASLADTIARFVPLAGRIVFVPSTGDAAIDCSEAGVAAAVRFVVAESDADAGRLAGEPDHDVNLLEQLAPVLHAAAFPAETMAAQVTRLDGGGVAVGVALHHVVVDGRSVWKFLEAWATACRGADTCSSAPGPTSLSSDELSRSVLRKYSLDLPVAWVAQALIENRMKLSRWTFDVAAPLIHRLKQHIASLMASPSVAASSLSSFVAITAITWVSFVQSKHPSIISANDGVYLFFFIDYRGRRAAIDLPIGEGFFGTCISGCLAMATVRDLLAEDGDGVAAAAVQKEARRAAADPLASWEWMSLVSSISIDRVVNMAGSTRFPAYEATDFGWGPPSRTELVTMNHDGQVVLVAGKGGHGGVQASVSLHPAHMDVFNSHFLNYLT
ncbi:hypothetical protein ABZP36_029770 [Zizania latifolia]